MHSTTCMVYIGPLQPLDPAFEFGCSPATSPLLLLHTILLLLGQHPSHSPTPPIFLLLLYPNYWSIREIDFGLPASAIYRFSFFSI